MSTRASGPRASDAQEAEWRADEGERLLVVGIGASAGGLEALERFLQRVPPDSGLAYVVVQHLSPEHESSLADILARATKLPVATAAEGQRIERDHVYVIPPGAGLVVEGGALRLVPFDPKGVRLLVNAFLTSLAEDQRENAVGDRALGDGLGRRPRHRGREAARGQDLRAAPQRRPVREHARRRNRDRDGGAGPPGRRDPGGAHPARQPSDGTIHPRAHGARRKVSSERSRWSDGRRGTTSAATSGPRSFAGSTGGWPSRGPGRCGSTPPCSRATPTRRAASPRT